MIKTVKKRKISISLSEDHPIFKLADSKKRGNKLREILNNYYSPDQSVEDRLNSLDAKLELIIAKINTLTNAAPNAATRVETINITPASTEMLSDATMAELEDNVEDGEDEIVFDVKAFFDLG